MGVGVCAVVSVVDVLDVLLVGWLVDSLVSW